MHSVHRLGGSCRRENAREESERETREARLYMALTPDAIHLSPSLSTPDPAADAGLAEGLSALESYKKKDPTKGSDAYTA
jgi:hypothetical protein